MTNEEMLKIALSKDLDSYDNLNLLLEVLKVCDDKNIAVAKRGYEIACKRTNQLAMKDIKLAGEFYELAHKFALYAATDDFDMYMIACEWNREPSARFWLPRRSVLEGKHHVATQIQEFIDDDKAKFLSLSVAPGTGKTTLIKFLLAYIAGRYPQSANMYISYSDGMVKMMYDSEAAILTDVSEYAHNDIFNNGSPLLSAEYNTISYKKKGDFPTLGIVSLGGSVTGRTRANKFMVTDDLVKNAQMARNPQLLENLYKDYKDTLTTRMIGDKCKQIMLGTIWSVHDPISKMKSEHEGEEGYKFIAIPVWDENEQSNFEYNHPDNYTTEKIREIKNNVDPVTFSCLYMQKPIEREGLLFNEDSLLYYNGVLPENIDIKVFVCDTAFGGGDSLAMPIVYVSGDRCYIDDVVFNTGDKDVTLPLVLGKIMEHTLNAGRFEGNNGGDWYAEKVDDMLREKNYHINIISQKAPNTSSKVARIIQYAPDIRKLYFRDKKHRSPEYQKFMDELCGFTQTGKNAHDDAPDSLAQLCDYLSTFGMSKPEIFRRDF